MNFMTFHIYIYIGNVIIPTDELIFFRGVAIAPTINCIYIYILSLLVGLVIFMMTMIMIIALPLSLWDWWSVFLLSL